MASNNMEPFTDLKPNGTSAGLLGFTENLDELYWIIPVTIAAIVFLFLTAYGLFRCIVDIGDCCIPKWYAVCGCCGPTKKEEDEERIVLLDYSRPTYESASNEGTGVQML